ncbi:MAG: pseudouridine synthase [Candidatus Nezhaarchaeota archaeon]|nr:pseudouridine synthase [Candidatus Nezhaarchaeota archaeon]
MNQVDALRKLMGLRRIRAIANYQFSEGVGDKIFPDEVELSFSRRTGRVRHIYLNNKLLATLRPNDGLLALTIEGARRLLGILPPPRMRIVVSSKYEEAIAKGRDVQAAWVEQADPDVRPGDEVLVVNAHDKLLAIGRAMLPGDGMTTFKAGLAVRVRRGVGVEEAKSKRD